MGERTYKTEDSVTRIQRPRRLWDPDHATFSATCR